MAFRYRTVLLVAFSIVGGCAGAKPALVLKSHRPAAIAWKGNEDLSLEQIVPVPRLKPPATQPDRKPPIDALALYAQSRDAAIRGQNQLVIESLQKAIAADPFRYQLRYDLGWAYLNANNDVDHAIAAFEKAAMLEPDHLALQSQLGRLFLGKSDPTSAIQYLRLAAQTQEYAEDDGQAAVADYFLARALKEGGYDRAALNQYMILLKRFEHPSLSLQSNAELAYLLERPDALFAQIGELLEKHGQYADAIDAFQACVDREPDNFEIQARYARDLAMDNRRDPALQKAVDLIVRTHAAPASLLVLRDVCQALDLSNGEVETLRQLSDRRPGDQAVLYALADTLIARGRPIEARQILEASWRKSPGNIALTRRLFLLYKRDNLVDSAAKLLIDSLAVNPDALHNFAPLWAELMRPGQVNRLKLPDLLANNADDSASREFWIAMSAADENRLALQRSAAEASTRFSPPFAPGYRLLLDLNLARPDLDDQQKRQASEALVKQAGDSALSFELAGRLQLSQKNPAAALELFKKSVLAGGTSADLQLVMADAGRADRNTGGHDGPFEQALWKIISDHPLYEDAYLDLFQYYANPKTGTAEQAMKVLAVWLQNDPQCSTARVSQVQTEIQQGLVKDAEADLNRLFDEDPDDTDVYRMMRQFYTQTGRSNDLIVKLEDQHARHPRDTDTAGRLVLLYAEQKREAEAVRLLDNVRLAVADNADLLYSLTSWYHELNQTSTVEDVLQQVVQLDPKHAGACNDLGFQWADEGKNLPQAEVLIRTAILAEPDNTSFLDSLGWVLYKRGKFDEARTYLQQAIAPSVSADSVVLDHLGDTMYRLSKTDDARSIWQRSLSGLGDGSADRGETRQLRLQLLQKIKQVEGKKPVDVSPVAAS